MFTNIQTGEGEKGDGGDSVRNSIDYSWKSAHPNGTGEGEGGKGKGNGFLLLGLGGLCWTLVYLERRKLLLDGKRKRIA